METSQARAVALFISIFLVAVPFAAADTGGYSTTPGLTGAVPDDHRDPVPISFWDLPLREMLLAVALSFCPVLVYPIELFFFLKLLTVLGYRKVEQNAISYNEKRQKIYDCIAEHPGLNFNELERLTCVAEGTLKYHMLILGGRRRSFPMAPAGPYGISRTTACTAKWKRRCSCISRTGRHEGSSISSPRAGKSPGRISRRGSASPARRSPGI